METKYVNKIINQRASKAKSKSLIQMNKKKPAINVKVQKDKKCLRTIVGISFVLHA